MDKITIEVVFLYNEILLKINLLLFEEKVISPYMFERAKEIIIAGKTK
jgi:hypothetical protein